MILGDAQFLAGGLAVEGGEVDLANRPGHGRLGFAEEIGAASGIGELAFHLGRIHEVQALGETARLDPLALADARSLGTAEHFQERSRTVVAVVGQRDRTRPGREIGEVGLRTGEHVDGVEEHLGLETLRIKVGEILPIDRVVLVRHGAELVGLALRDDADDGPEIELALDEVFCQGIEQLGICRGIRVANVILGLDETAFEEVLPVAVHERFREERIRGLAHPVGEEETRILVGQDLRRSLTERGRHHLFHRLLVFNERGAAFVKDEILARNRRRLAPDLGEKGGEGVVVALAPALEGMVMALRALHPHPEEKLGDVLLL